MQACHTNTGHKHSGKWYLNWTDLNWWQKLPQLITLYRAVQDQFWKSNSTTSTSFQNCWKLRNTMCCVSEWSMDWDYYLRWVCFASEGIDFINTLFQILHLTWIFYSFCFLILPAFLLKQILNMAVQCPSPESWDVKYFNVVKPELP